MEGYLEPALSNPVTCKIVPDQRDTTPMRSILTTQVQQMLDKYHFGITSLREFESSWCEEHGWPYQLRQIQDGFLLLCINPRTWHTKVFQLDDNFKETALIIEDDFIRHLAWDQNARRIILARAVPPQILRDDFDGAIQHPNNSIEILDEHGRQLSKYSPITERGAPFYPIALCSLSDHRLAFFDLASQRLHIMNASNNSMIATLFCPNRLLPCIVDGGINGLYVLSKARDNYYGFKSDRPTDTVEVWDTNTNQLRCIIDDGYSGASNRNQLYSLAMAGGYLFVNGDQAISKYALDGTRVFSQPMLHPSFPSHPAYPLYLIHISTSSLLPNSLYGLTWEIRFNLYRFDI